MADHRSYIVFNFFEIIVQARMNIFYIITAIS